MRGHIPNSVATQLWTRYTRWLQQNMPAHYANLAPPASPEAIAELERHLGIELPQGVKDVWRINNGQIHSMHSTSDWTPEMLEAIPTLTFYSTEMVRLAWDSWAKLRASQGEEWLEEMGESCSSMAEGKIRCAYSDPRWIPLWGDLARPDYVGVDLNPDVEGHAGQIINFGRNEDDKFVAAESFEQLLEILLWEVEVGCWLPHQKPERPARDEDGDDEEEDEDDEPTWNGHFFMALHGHFRWRTAGVPRSWSYLVVEDEGTRYFWREDGLSRRDLNQLLGRSFSDGLFVYRSRDHFIRVLREGAAYDLIRGTGEPLARGATRDVALQLLGEFVESAEGPKCPTKEA